MIDAEDIGGRDSVDYLHIGFSSPDYAGHYFGPASLEYEDAILRLDGVLEELFRHVNKSVGLYRTLIVLSSDHGGPEIPEHVAEFGIDAGRFPLDWMSEANPLAEQLEERFGRGDLIANHTHPYLYLNVAAIEEMGIDVAEIERFVADEIMAVPGIALAIPRADMLAGEVPGRSAIPAGLVEFRSGAIGQCAPDTGSILVPALDQEHRQPGYRNAARGSRLTVAL